MRDRSPSGLSQRCPLQCKINQRRARGTQEHEYLLLILHPNICGPREAVNVLVGLPEPFRFKLGTVANGTGSHHTYMASTLGKRSLWESGGHNLHSLLAPAASAGMGMKDVRELCETRGARALVV